MPETQSLPLASTLSRRRVLAGALAGSGLLLAGSPGLSRAAEPQAVPRAGQDVFVDPVRGRDDLDGSRPVVGANGKGPVASLSRATAIVAQRAADSSAAVQVWLRGGTYRVTDTWLISPFPRDVAVSFNAFPGEKPVVDGSQIISGWSEATVNGRTAWTATVPDVDGAPWYFTQLFVDGGRRPRPRLPKAANDILENDHSVTDRENQFYAFAEGTQDEGGFGRTFVYREGDIDPTWRNLTDVDVVAMREWFDERSPIESVDPATRTATVKFRPYYGKPWVKRVYYVENVAEALTEPGEWYLDRETKVVTYLPKPGERLEKVTLSAPRARHLLRIAGTEPAPVRNVRFEGITFTGSAWDYWIRPSWETGQSAVNTVGAIELTYATNSAFERCTITTVGEFGIVLNEGCSEITIARNTISDTGSGGVKLMSNVRNPEINKATTGRCTIVDNTIHHGGRVFHMAAGILAGDIFETTIAHNHVHDLFYTGISVGWTWGFETASPAHHNIVEANYIHDLGKNLLWDMAGIYTLGRQPGTLVRGNHVHDVAGYSNPTSGLYADEGTSFIQWTNNLVHGCGSGFIAPNQSAGNLVANNIFADNYLYGVAGGRNDLGGLAEFSVQVRNNVIAVNHVPALIGGSGFSTTQPVLRSDNNLLWNYSGDLGDVSSSDRTGGLVKLLRTADESDVEGGAVEVDLDSAEPGTFAFAELPEPVTLEPDTGYLLVMQVASGGPYWRNPCPIVTTSAAGVVGPVYRSNSTGHYIGDPGTGAFGPLNLTYLDADGATRELVTSVQLTGALRSDYTGFLGVSLKTGGAPVRVTSLGRLSTGVTWWDTWRSAGLDANSVIADPLFRNHRDCALTRRSPALRPPVSFVPLDLSGVGPRR